MHPCFEHRYLIWVSDESQVRESLSWRHAVMLQWGVMVVLTIIGREGTEDGSEYEVFGRRFVEESEHIVKVSLLF